MFAGKFLSRGHRLSRNERTIAVNYVATSREPLIVLAAVPFRTRLRRSCSTCSMQRWFFGNAFPQLMLDSLGRRYGGS